MPIYEYQCSDHGIFEQLRSLSEWTLPGDCPHCAEPARRILSRPNLASVPRSEMIARDRNEKSRHEPTVSRTPDCGHDHKAQPKLDRTKTHVYTGPRPWVMEHA